MSNGRKGAYNIFANTVQSVGQCNDLEAMVATVSICNRSNTTAIINLAVTDTVNSFDSLGHYIEYDLELLPKNVLERTSITLNRNQFITVSSSVDGISAVTWGAEYGLPASGPDITVVTPAGGGGGGGGEVLPLDFTSLLTRASATDTFGGVSTITLTLDNSTLGINVGDTINLSGSELWFSSNAYGGSASRYQGDRVITFANATTIEYSTDSFGGIFFTIPDYTNTANLQDGSGVGVATLVARA